MRIGTGIATTLLVLGVALASGCIGLGRFPSEASVFAVGAVDSYAVDPTSGAMVVSRVSASHERQLVHLGEGGVAGEIIGAEEGYHYHAPWFDVNGSLYAVRTQIDQHDSCGFDYRSEIVRQDGEGVWAGIFEATDYIGALTGTERGLAFYLWTGSAACTVLPYSINGGSYWEVSLDSGAARAISDRFGGAANILSSSRDGQVLLGQDGVRGPVRFSGIESPWAPYRPTAEVLAQADLESAGRACINPDGDGYSFLSSAGTNRDVVYFWKESDRKIWRGPTLRDVKQACYEPLHDSVFIIWNYGEGQASGLSAWNLDTGEVRPWVT